MGISPRQNSPPPPRKWHTVFTGTIGDLRVIARALADPWAGGGIGRPQLKLMWSLLVARVGRPVDRDDLVAVATPNWRDLVKPQNLPGGLLNKLHRWGLGPAIHRGERTITLRRHPCWISDVDLIQRYHTRGVAQLRSGDERQALEWFRRAAKHCGGIYLQSFDVQGYDITAEQQHWESYQRDVLHHLLRLCLSHHQHNVALDGAAKLRLLGEPTRDDCLLLADVYAAIDMPQLARHYRQKADDD